MSIDFEINNSVIIDDVKIIKPSIARDHRGNIWTSFLEYDINRLLPDKLHFKHDKFSESKHNVLRGIHGDLKTWKLVTCVFGEIFQVVVDLRKDSPTYKKWESFLLHKNNQSLILLPPGIGNAYYVSSNIAIYHYKLAYKGKYLDFKDQFTHQWNDKSLNIEWPTSSPILSSRDNFTES
jgi:dTDP-4-dehydrorhamnose 3,5-epimerase